MRTTLSTTTTRLIIPSSNDLEKFLSELTQKFSHLWQVSTTYSIPSRAIIVANHPYLHDDDWIDINDIPEEYGNDEKGWQLLQVRIIRTLLWRQIVPDARIIIRAIGYRKLFESLNCIHLPDTKGEGYQWCSKQFDFYNQLILYPEGGNQTGQVHSSFAKIAINHYLPVVFCRLSPITSLFHYCSLNVEHISTISSVEEGISLFKRHCL